VFRDQTVNARLNGFEEAYCVIGLVLLCLFIANEVDVLSAYHAVTIEYYHTTTLEGWIYGDYFRHLFLEMEKKKHVFIYFFLKASKSRTISWRY
jgi:hypothetical protein